MQKLSIKKKKQLMMQFPLLLLVLVIGYLVLKDMEKDNKMGGEEFRKDGECIFVSLVDQSIKNIDVEYANTKAKREMGLMNIDQLGENQGMFFFMPEEDTLSFWMKDTKIPLDIIFINTNKEIVTIHKNTIPMSTTYYRSTKPAKYVVEVNAGFTDKNKIKVGDKVVW